MTAEKIMEIAEQNIGKYELGVLDTKEILKAAGSDAMSIAFYAYKYGFLRGQRAEKARQRKKVSKA